jgi:hypothetical protein
VRGGGEGEGKAIEQFTVRSLGLKWKVEEPLMALEGVILLLVLSIIAYTLSSTKLEIRAK